MNFSVVLLTPYLLWTTSNDRTFILRNQEIYFYKEHPYAKFAIVIFSLDGNVKLILWSRTIVALKKDLSILILFIHRFWDNIAPNSRQLLPWDAAQSNGYHDTM